MGFSSRRCRYLTRTNRKDETIPLWKCAHLLSARPIWAKKRRRPNTKHDLNRSKSTLLNDEFRIGGALTRREQSPEPEQTSFENWRLLAEGPNMGFSSGRHAHFTKAARHYETQICKTCTPLDRQAPVVQKGMPTKS
jgi:hypothetical protein